MKLEGVLEDTVYASHRRAIYTDAGNLEFNQVGRLPGIGLRTTSPQRLIQTNSVSKALLTQLIGPYLTTNLWPVSTDQFYATCGNHLFRSSDAGKTWTAIRQLPSSSGPMGILPSGLCVHEGTIYVGEYPLDRTQHPRLLVSPDEGDTWRTIETVDARHIHAIQIDPFTEECWITTGDADDDSMITRVSDGHLEVIGTGSQRWRAVELVFTPSSIIWGMDCPYTTENHILKLDRSELGADGPRVETLHTVSSPVYYAESVEIDGEYHVFFSTAIEPATAPAHTARVLHASSADGFRTWQTLAAYSKGAHPLSTFVDTNSYIFMSVHPERGLFLNPYNTDTDHGTIRTIPVTRFQH